MPDAGRWSARVRARLRGDWQLRVVLLVWAGCCLAYAVYLHRFNVPLPCYDEWDLTPAATGEAPLTWQWLWTPANQHRAPLTRLEVVLLGWAQHWDLRLARYVNLGLLGLGSLALSLAARTVRGRSSLADAFLPLLILTPAQFESVVVFAYSYAMALAWLAVAVSAAATGWPLRSLSRLVLYLALALGVTLAGGPAGNLWALGLCAVVLRGWLEQRSRAWLAVGLVGTAVVGAASVWMLLAIPRVPLHEALQSDSLPMLWAATARLAVGWMGYPFVSHTWPWASVVLVIPLLYGLGRILADLGRAYRVRAFGPKGDGTLPTGVPSPFGPNALRAARPALASWTDLTVMLLAALGVALMIGYARGKCAIVWDSRYCTLVAPIGVVLYLLLVRLRAPRVLPFALALWMAVCVGANWRFAVVRTRELQDPVAALARALQEGHEPLATLSARFSEAVGCVPPGQLLTNLEKLHHAGLSVFRQPPPDTPGKVRSLVWEAESGRLSRAFEVVADEQATGKQALRVKATTDQPATADYRLDIPAAGSYQLCCRLWAPFPGGVLRVRLDEEQTFESTLPVATGYYALRLDPLLELSAGGHTLTLTLSTPGTRLDLLELVSCPPARSARPHGSTP